MDVFSPSSIDFGNSTATGCNVQNLQRDSSYSTNYTFSVNCGTSPNNDLKTIKPRILAGQINGYNNSNSESVGTDIVATLQLSG
jgi:hypothetical protein